MLVGLDKHAAVPNTVKDISIMFMTMTTTKVIALIVIGLIGGLLSGFIGSGGAFVLTPAMMSLGAPVRWRLPATCVTSSPRRWSVPISASNTARLT